MNGNRENDPAEDLLERAFAEEEARLCGVDVAGAVIKQLRTRQRLRLAVTAVAVLTGSAVLALSAPPLLQDLMQNAPEIAAAAGTSKTWLAALAAAAVVALLMFDEPLS